MKQTLKALQSKFIPQCSAQSPDDFISRVWTSNTHGSMVSETYPCLMKSEQEANNCIYSILIKKTSKYKIDAKTFILRLSLVAATIFLIRFKNNRPHELRNSNEYNFVQTYNYLSFIEVIPWKLHSYLFKSLVLNP